MTYPPLSTSGAPTADAIARALAQNPDYKKYAGNNTPAAILAAYESGNWAGVTDLTGKPFTDEQQQAAVREAERVLGPAYEAEKTYDTAAVEDALGGALNEYNTFQRDNEISFDQNKQALDENAADKGVLFSGARIQKQNDLRRMYANRDADARRRLASTIGGTARNYQYTYGDDAARGLSSYYQVPGAQTYNPSVARGGVRTGSTPATVYTPGSYSFQGTKPVAQKAAVQTRAAGVLANRANKLSLSGMGAKL